MRYLAWLPLFLLGCVLEFAGTEIKDLAKKRMNPEPEDPEDDPDSE